MKAKIAVLVNFLLGFNLLLGAQYDINLIPFEGSPKANAAFVDLMTVALNRYKSTGTLPTGSPTSLSDARRIDHITADSLMTSTKIFYQRSFSPSGAWANGNGNTVWIIAGASSKVGANDLSLSMFMADLDSNDYGNHSLRQHIAFTGNSYTSLAIGWRADGTQVTTGSADQLVAKVVVVIGFKSYDVETNDEVKQVGNYISGDYSVSIALSVGQSSKSLTVSLVTPIVLDRPVLRAGRVGGKPSLIVADDGRGNTEEYPLLGSSNPSGPYQDAGVVRGGQSYTFVMKAGNGTTLPMAFFKYP